MLNTIKSSGSRNRSRERNRLMPPNAPSARDYTKSAAYSSPVDNIRHYSRRGIWKSVGDALICTTKTSPAAAAAAQSLHPITIAHPDSFSVYLSHILAISVVLWQH